MTPLTIKLAIQAAIVLAIFAGGAAAGWTVNGWRLGTKLEHVERERDAAVSQGVVLADGLKACNAGVDQAKKTGDAAVRLMGALLGEVRKGNQAKQLTIADLEALLAKGTPAGAGCEQAWGAIEAQRKARGAQ